MHAVFVRLDPDRRERLRRHAGRYVKIAYKIRRDRRQRRVAVEQRVIQIEDDAFDLHTDTSLDFSVRFSYNNV